MAKAKNYTLTKKNSIKGKDYYIQKGDVIDQAQYNKLADRHKEYFEEGAKTLEKETPTDADQNARITALEDRIAVIDEKLKIDSEKLAAKKAAETEEKSARKGTKE